MKPWQKLLKLLLLISILPLGYMCTYAPIYQTFPDLPRGCEIFPGAKTLVVYPGGIVETYKHNSFTGWEVDRDTGLDWARQLYYVIERQKDFNEAEESPWE